MGDNSKMPAYAQRMVEVGRITPDLVLKLAACLQQEQAENARLREEFSRDMAALYKAAGLSGGQSLIQELPRLREAAARLDALIRRLEQRLEAENEGDQGPEWQARIWEVRGFLDDLRGLRGEEVLRG